jgi:hypothetical protein
MRRVIQVPLIAAFLMLAVATHAENQPQPSPSPAPSAKEATPAPAAKEASPAPAAKQAPPASVTIIAPREAHGVLGRDVRSPTDEDMGHIVDVIVDRTGTVRAAVIDFGGFLGVGSRKIAVEWNAMHFPPPLQTDAKISLELTRDQVKAAPEYQDGKPVVVLGALGKLEPLPFQ